ncbi:RDD family protein [Alteriqipengyuania sp. WL0013]|uniref:RDD family protein n=1 Tax=Alteriqipengyuania sp. WL0013 TaxID=3110773 RepID=UPI002C5C7AAB|nr:RDD family protein [Alteriqipengyuania sp. WL0013]MEB3416666.1 RDD family protein [Alteriqipengyuania sp. WL0013]
MTPLVPDAGAVRAVVTPEGLPMKLALASRGARFGALVLDLTIMAVTVLAVFLLALWAANGAANLERSLEGLAIVVILFLFFFKNGYFAFFELGPRGATPGKRAVGIRVADRSGGRLSAEAVIARNLLREVEIFIPIIWLLTSDWGSLVSWLGLLWFGIFSFFLFFNKDRMRAGDIIAGTWVVERPRSELGDLLSASEGARGRSASTGATYRFGEEELSVYGEHELQVLERVLREDRPDAIEQVAQTIAAKIGWDAGSGDERVFLEAFYAQLRARLERGMQFGNRKKDKFS